MLKRRLGTLTLVLAAGAGVGACGGSEKVRGALTALATSQLESSCEGGSMEGCDALAKQLVTEAGENVELGRQAIALWTRACEGGLADGCYNLGVAFRKGVAGPPALPAAVAAWEQGCRLDGLRACAELGTALMAGNGVQADDARARLLLTGACDKGHWPACHNLGVLLSGAGEHPAALAALTKACDHDFASSCVNLGAMHSMGRGTPNDQAKAAEIWRKACRLGSTKACGAVKDLEQSAKTSQP
jgi:TPR repeat protein